MEGEEEDEDCYSFAVIGGGIAGVSCVEQILEFDQDARILLISASPVVKEACQITRLTKTLEDFIIVEKSLKSFRDVHQSVRVVHGHVERLIHEEKVLILRSGERFRYKKVCICSGATPKVLFPGWEHVLGIRDTESVQELASRISKARKVLLLGNGGIATEFVHEVNGVDIVWAIKDQSICAHFVDPGAAEFFVQCRLSREEESTTSSKTEKDQDQALPTASTTSVKTDDKTPPSKRRKYTIASISSSSQQSTSGGGASGTSGSFGSALGPDWHQGLKLTGQNLGKNVKILYETECLEVKKSGDLEDSTEDEGNWPIFCKITNGTMIGCDLVISATGVVPNLGLFKEDERGALEKDLEKGIFVDSQMRTSLPDVYAAGDVCFPNWEWSKHWFQMRLWTQARHMGLYTGKSMWMSLQKDLNPIINQDPIDLDFCFECFSHVTRFFGFKVVLLGLYNGQGLDKTKQHLLIRCTKNLEFVKVVLEDWRMQGAVLIGDTGLEETFENLILNQVDLSSYGEDLLNPDIDIEDYFD